VQKIEYLITLKTRFLFLENNDFTPMVKITHQYVQSNMNNWKQRTTFQRPVTEIIHINFCPVSQYNKNGLLL
jgi:hypothetical protein